jgi:PadR family transcriptional regulator, phenolic acid-responsive transcriptional regulator
MSVKYAILGLLHYQNMHGYRIKRHIERHFGHMWSINYGQIYPNLKRMEDEGLVTKKEEARSGTPSRKLYSVTTAGREAFARWLASEPRGTMLLRDPFLLRFVFFGFGSKERALDQVDEQIRSYEAQLRKRQENIRRWQREGVYVRRMAELGLLLNEVILEWLRQSRREIELSSEAEAATTDVDLPID